MAREWVIRAYDGFEGLELVECALEEPGPTDVRLRVEAFALNWGDEDLMNDRYSFSFSAFPARIGIEAAGIVDAVGKDVQGIEVGERYSTLPYFYDRRGASADTLQPIDLRHRRARTEQNERHAAKHCHGVSRVSDSRGNAIGAAACAGAAT